MTPMFLRELSYNCLDMKKKMRKMIAMKPTTHTAVRHAWIRIAWVSSYRVAEYTKLTAITNGTAYHMSNIEVMDRSGNILGYFLFA